MINDHLRGLFLQFIWVFVLCYHQRREDLRVLVYVWKAVYSLLQRRDWTWTRSLFKLFHVPASVKQVSSASGPNEKGVFEFWVHKSNKKTRPCDFGWKKWCRMNEFERHSILGVIGVLLSGGEGGGDWALPSALPKAPGHDSNHFITLKRCWRLEEIGKCITVCLVWPSVEETRQIYCCLYISAEETQLATAAVQLNERMAPPRRGSRNRGYKPLLWNLPPDIKRFHSEKMSKIQSWR